MSCKCWYEIIVVRGQVLKPVRGLLGVWSPALHRYYNCAQGQLNVTLPSERYSSGCGLLYAGFMHIACI
jgi:hypothetical protein